jgi:PAS domain S-box-containing protein
MLDSPSRGLDIAGAVNLLAGSLDPSKTLDGVLVLVSEALATDHVAVLALDEFGNLTIVASRNTWLSGNPQERTIAWAALHSPDPIRCPDLRETDYLSLVSIGELEPRSYLFVPIQVGSERLGLIEAVSTEVDAFSASDEVVLASLGRAAGLALRNARDYQASRRRERLAGAGAAITAAVSEARDLGQVLQVAVDAATDCLEARGAAILLAAGDGRHLRLAAEHNAPPGDIELLQNLPVDSKELSARAYREGRLLYYRSAAEIAADPEVELDVIRVGSSEAILSVPLVYLGERLGVMTIVFDQPHAFLADELDTVQGLAVQAAAVVANAAALKRAEERAEELRLTVEQMAEGLVQIGLDGRVTYLNPTAIKLLGLQDYESDINEGYRRLRYILDDGRELQPLDRLPRLVREGQVLSQELTVIRPDGRRIIIAFNASPLKGPNGEITGAISVFRDITLERLHEAELTQSRGIAEERLAQLRTTLESMADGVALIDRNLQLVYYNPAAVRMTGMSVPPGTTLGDALQSIQLYRRDGSRFLIDDSLGRQALESGEDVSSELTSRLPDGNELSLAVTASPVRTETGEIVGAVVALRDITAESLHAAELEASRALAEESAAQLGATLEHMSDGVILVNNKGQIVLANAASARLTGVVVPMGTPFARGARRLRFFRLNGEEIDVPQEIISLQTVITGQGGTVDVIVERPDSSRVTLRVTASPVRTPDGKVLGAVSVLRDITEEQARQESLEELNRLKDDFLSVVSHELKTPLTTVVGYAHLLQRQFAGRDEESDFAFREMLSEANRMVGIINTLLEISRIQSGGLVQTFDLDYVDLTRLVARLARTSEVTYPHTPVESSVPAETIEILADRGRVEQVLTNLLDNAVRYTAGGKVTLSVTADDREAVVSVSDEGQGISPEEQETIFEPYGQGLRRHKSGLGLGLYIAREIVEAHGGRIWVESQVGHGATFRVAFPRVEQPDTEGHALEADRP